MNQKVNPGLVIVALIILVAGAKFGFFGAVIVPEGSTWKYMNVTPPAGWELQSFDDSSWYSDVTPLYYTGTQSKSCSNSKSCYYSCSVSCTLPSGYTVNTGSCNYGSFSHSGRTGTCTWRGGSGRYANVRVSAQGTTPPTWRAWFLAIPDLYARKSFTIATYPKQYNLSVEINGGIDCWVNDVKVIDELNTKRWFGKWNYRRDITNYLQGSGFTNIVSCQMRQLGGLDPRFDAQIDGVDSGTCVPNTCGSTFCGNITDTKCGGPDIVCGPACPTTTPRYRCDPSLMCVQDDVWGTYTVPDCNNCSLQVFATCSDGIQNQGETGVDCGGPCPTSCGTSFPPTCFDGIQNQDETDIDCGGTICSSCGNVTGSSGGDGGTSGGGSGGGTTIYSQPGTTPNQQLSPEINPTTIPQPKIETPPVIQQQQSTFLSAPVASSTYTSSSNVVVRVASNTYNGLATRYNSLSNIGRSLILALLIFLGYKAYRRWKK